MFFFLSCWPCPAASFSLFLFFIIFLYYQVPSRKRGGIFVPHHQTDRSLSSLRPPRSLSSFIESIDGAFVQALGVKVRLKKKDRKKGEPFVSLCVCVSIDLFRPNVSIQSSHPCKKKKKKLRAYTQEFGSILFLLFFASVE